MDRPTLRELVIRYNAHGISKNKYAEFMTEAHKDTVLLLDEGLRNCQTAPNG